MVSDYRRNSKSWKFVTNCALQLVMLLWSYFSVVLTDPGGVPPNWRPAVDEERGEADPLNGSEFNDLQPDPLNQRVRYCRKCSQLKPPRCHHCSVCESLMSLRLKQYLALLLLCSVILVSKSDHNVECISLFQVGGAYWKWITIVYGLSIVLGP